MVIVATNDYLESDWCRREVEGGLIEMTTRRTNYIIAIKLEELHQDVMTAEFKQFIHSYKYLDATDRDFWDKLKCFLPLPSGNANEDVGVIRWGDFQDDDDEERQLVLQDLNYMG
jgi:hypothetical protein